MKLQKLTKAAGGKDSALDRAARNSMRIAVLTAGSRGDVQPLAVLSQELLLRGHEVRFWAQEEFSGLARTFNLPFFGWGGTSPREVLADVEKTRPRTMAGRVLRILRRKHPPVARLSELERACRDVDGVVLSTTSTIGKHAAEAAGTRYVICHVSPTYRNSAYPSPALPFRHGQGRIRNALSHVAAEQLFWMADRSWVNQWRTKRLGLRPLPLRLSQRHGGPALFGFSHAVLPRPRDWPKDCHITGYWFPKTSVDPDPDGYVAKFLEKPAIAVGFGSSISTDPQFLKSVHAAVRLAGQRAVFVEGWSKLDDGCDGESTISVSSIDYRWLFSRVGAVVHTGGSGTSALALLTGTPSVTVPFGGDQRFWAWRLQDLGVGTNPISRRSFTAEALADQIRTVIQEAHLR